LDDNVAAQIFGLSAVRVQAGGGLDLTSHNIRCSDAGLKKGGLEWPTGDYPCER